MRLRRKRGFRRRHLVKAYAFRRLAISAVLLALVSLVIFVVLRIVPGDPVVTLLGATPGSGGAGIAHLRHELGLDKSILRQYVDWVGGVLRGDFGKSYFSQYSVTSLINQRLWPTVELTIVSILLALVIAVPAGIVAAMWPHSLADRLLTGFVSVGIALPPFLLGIFFIAIFAVKLGLFPTRGYVSLLDDPVGNLRSVALPGLTLAIVAAAPILRFLRASLLETLSAPFIRTAQGKGLLRRQVVLRHALPNALIPTVTVVGLIIGYTLAGVVIVEYLFGWSGLGALAIESVYKRDYAVLQSVVLLVAGIFILTNFVVDLLYGLLDPRLRVTSG